jgi:hypothetical protein
MKIDARDIRFHVPMLPSPTHHRLWLVGGGNTLQLLETALVIEGHVKRFFLPVADFFLGGLLSEWTTITVPYSCIVRHHHARRRLARAVVTVVFWLPVLLLALGGPGADTGAVLYMAGLFGFLALVATLYVNLRMLAPRDYLLFRTADGRRVLTAFRIRSRKRQEDFAAQLESNRRTAGGLKPQLPGKEPAPALPLALLVAYLVAHYLALPLWRIIAPPVAHSLSLGHSPPLFQVSSLFMYFVYAQGPVLLLATLAWRWNEAIRWTAVLFLAVRGLGAVIGPASWALLRLSPPASWQAPGGLFETRPGYLDFGFEDVMSLVFHLLLAILLAARPAPERPALPGSAAGPGKMRGEETGSSVAPARRPGAGA